MATIREPKKVTSKLKKKKIIEAGLQVFTTKGYHNTTTVDIAKEAKVSTGIVYSYFIDKKDIFLHCLRLYLDNLYALLLINIASINANNFDDIIKKIISDSISSHMKNQNAHELMIGMSHTYNEVNEMFLAKEQELTEKIAEILIKNNLNTTHLHEKIHLAFNLIENLCHECVYHNHQNTNNDILIELNIKIIKTLFEEAQNE